MTLRTLAVIAPFGMFLMPPEQMQLFGAMFAMPAWFVLAIMLRQESKGGVR